MITVLTSFFSPCSKFSQQSVILVRISAIEVVAVDRLREVFLDDVVDGLVDDGVDPETHRRCDAVHEGKSEDK